MPANACFCLGGKVLSLSSVCEKVKMNQSPRFHERSLAKCKTPARGEEVSSLLVVLR